MDRIVQQNAASAEESASASQELTAQSHQMKGIVYDLMAMVAGGSNGGGQGKSGRHALLESLPLMRAAAGNPYGYGRKNILIHDSPSGEVQPDEVIPLEGDHIKKV